MRLLRIMTAAVVLSAPGGVVAQPPAELGIVRGRVLDSLVTGSPLAGATVELVELARQTVTDPRGVFRFDSIPVGTYLLTFSHPDLTAFGFTAPEQTIRVDRGMAPPILLATPSPATVYHRLCPAPREADTGVLLGTIRDPGTSRPVAATIRGEWVVNLLSPDGGMTRQPRGVQSAADSTGRFQLCGVPTDVAVAVWTSAGNGDGGPIEVSLAGKEVGVRHLTHSLADPLTAQQAKVQGVVTGGGRPVVMAHVRILGRERRATSDATGQFVLDSLPAGSHTLEASALGF
ncbi:MAG: carboxypeptidase regulatory-like domain-containing protein, partial [Gemmatimonadales bacterium]